MTLDTGQAARVTIQDFFLRYPHLAGMTGTALNSAREIEPHLSAARRADSDQSAGHSPAIAEQIFGTADAKK